MLKSYQSTFLFPSLHTGVPVLSETSANVDVHLTHFPTHTAIFNQAPVNWTVHLLVCNIHTHTSYPRLELNKESLPPSLPSYILIFFTHPGVENGLNWKKNDFVPFKQLKGHLDYIKNKTTKHSPTHLFSLCSSWKDSLVNVIPVSSVSNTVWFGEILMVNW